MHLDHTEYNKICKLLLTSNAIYREYQWLLNSYVSDFYVKKHWQNLPTCWRETLQSINSNTLASLIDCTKPILSTNIVFPLSLLTLRVLVRYLQVPRAQSSCSGIPTNPIVDSLLPEALNIFWKRVKFKKRHEIEIMSKICYKMTQQTNCQCVVDIGSGLGHLTRMLSFGYGLKVCGLEAEERYLDKELEKTLYKHGSSKNVTPPTHLNLKVKTHLDGLDIIKILEDTFGKELHFGIVGLHPCGDLATTLLQLFAKYPKVKFINVVGCCYMKLNTLNNFGYPISNICKQYGCVLSYSSLEIACHALEMYVKKLKSNECGQLKIHSFRAALEKLMVTKHPEKCHSQVGSVKYDHVLTFAEYVNKATSKMDVELLNSEIESDEIKNDLADWRKIVTFYSVRLMLAPLIETIILLDRGLFIIESGHQCYITSVFDPTISPRNYVDVPAVLQDGFWKKNKAVLMLMNVPVLTLFVIF